jgi:hypothetical protein
MTNLRACLTSAFAVLAFASAAPAAAGDPDAIFADGFDPQPIAAPPASWTWVDFPDAFCGNGSATGLGINPSPVAGSRVLIFLFGGGGCWDTATCITLQTAANFNTGYGAAEFAASVPSLNTGFFDRARVTNPFRDYSFVVLPYCSGDVFAGNNPSINYGGNTRRHVGYANVGAYLERLVPTFRDAPRVYLTGASAGGFGAVYNWARTQAAFGSVRVDMIDDSGTFMPASIVPTNTAPQLARFNTWNLAATLPPDCTACANGLDNLYTYNAQRFPNQRGAWLTFRSDATISAFYQITTAQFAQGVDLVRVQHFDPFPNRRYFIVTGTNHVMFTNPALAGAGGVTLEQFLTLMLNDDPGWVNVAP